MMNRLSRSSISTLNSARIPEILAEHPEASTTSTYYSTRLPPLSADKSPSHPAASISIIRGDTFTAAKSLIDKYNEKVCVLNMASDKTPGGGYLSGSRAQEECLCYRSTLYPTFDHSWYPLTPLGAIYTDNVVVFRKEVAADSAEEFERKEDRFNASVISIAGLRQRHVDLEKNVYKSEESEKLLRAKIRQVLRACAVNGQSILVLGAIGCGAFRNPPKLVAKHFRSVLEEKEFMGWFKTVVFGILDSGNKEKNGDVFEEAMEGVVVGSGGSGETGESDGEGAEFSSFQNPPRDSFGRRGGRGGGGGRGNGRGRGRGNGDSRGGGRGGRGRGQ